MISASHADSRDFSSLVLDLTAMLDVIFILLVFFILTANAPQRALDMALPSKGADQATPLDNRARLNLHLLPEQRWAMDQQDLNTWPEVARALARAALQNQPVLIAGDRSIPMEQLLQVLAETKRVGLVNVQVLMNNPTQTRDLRHE